MPGSRVLDYAPWTAGSAIGSTRTHAPVSPGPDLVRCGPLRAPDSALDGRRGVEPMQPHWHLSAAPPGRIERHLVEPITVDITVTVIAVLLLAVAVFGTIFPILPGSVLT